MYDMLCCHIIVVLKFKPGKSQYLQESHKVQNMKHGKSHFSQVFSVHPALRRMVDLRQQRWMKKGIGDGGESECSTVAVGIGYNYLV